MGFENPKKSQSPEKSSANHASAKRPVDPKTLKGLGGKAIRGK
jgi:hypothetical protein